ncbi:MAG: hypothetical protein E6G67_08110 [Actinobacteria bacterium]|nr:MAG: hypothetical protein E6G67_08110 [Actinomycetota bacterium]
MHTWALDRAAHELGKRRRKVVEAGLLAAAAGAAAAAGFAFSVGAPVEIALAAGAGLEAILALASLVGRREQVARLALEPAAYALPEVSRYGMRLSRPHERARLAAWLCEVVADAQLPETLYLADRVAPVTHELEALARELVSPALTVQPASAVSCRRLLTRMVESPLYNPNLPAEELLGELRRIRGGIGAT